MIKFVNFIFIFIIILTACGNRVENPLADSQDKGTEILINVDKGDGLITKEDPATPLSDIFTVVLGKQPNADVIIGPIISSDTAEVIVTPATLTFTSADWDIPQTVTVTGVDDLILDGVQTVVIDLGLSSSSSSEWNNLDPGDLTVSNLDDEVSVTPGVLVLSGDGIIADETGITDNFNVVLNSAPAADVTISTITSSDTGEVTVSPSSLTFTTANWDTPQAVTVTGVDDAVNDGMQAVTIAMGTTSSTDSTWNALAVSSATAYNLDDEIPPTPGVIVSAGSTKLVSEDNTTSSFEVVLMSQPTADVDIAVAVSDTSEGTITAPFTGVSGTLTFTNSSWDSPQTVTVQGVNDANADGNQPFSVTLGTTSSTDVNYNGAFDPPDVSFTNLDNESAGVTVNAGTAMLVSESLNSSSFQVVLNSEPTANVTINVSVSDTSEGTITTPFTGTSGTLTFTSATWDIAQTVTVQGVNDDEADGNQAFDVVLGATGSTDTDYNGTFDPDDVSFTNVDNDTYGISVSIGDGLITNESGLSDTFSVVLNSAPTADVNLTAIVSGDTGEVTVSPNALTFTTGNWSTAQTVTVTGVDDALIDAEQIVTIDLGTATSTDTNYNSLDPGDVTVYNLDNETPAQVIVFSEMPLVTTENGGEVVLKLVLNKQPLNDVVLSGISSLDTNNGIVTAPSTSSLTFSTTNWNIPHLIKIQGQTDGDSTDSNYDVDLGTTSSTDSNWNGIDPGDVSLINKELIEIGGYSWSSVYSAGSFNTISGTGNLVSFYWLDPVTPYSPYDEGYAIAPLGFSFNFMGIYYSHIFIYTNGFASFSDEIYNANCFANQLLFMVLSPDEFVDILAPWWDDLSTLTGSVYYQTTGPAGSRIFTIEWRDVYVVVANDTYTFQLKLYESTNRIEFVYGDGIVSGNGTTASIGLKDDAAMDPLNYWLDGFNGSVGNDSSYGAANYQRTFAQYPGLDQVITFTQP